MQEKEAELNLMALHDHQKTTAGSNSLSDSFDLTLPAFYLDQQSPSTRILKLAQTDIQLRPIYKLHSRILQHTSITQNMRARLRSFLIAQTAKQCILRQTCALACYLVDLYFAFQGQVGINEFQSLVIGCLILAAKLREGKFPTISFNTFNREQLLGYQKKIARRLCYNLTPPTYYNYAEKAVFMWDTFTSQSELFNLKIAQVGDGVNHTLRRFYEQLDCVYMVLKSLDYDIEDLVLNLLYLNARMINVYQIESPAKLTDSKFREAFYPHKDKFKDFYSKFLLFYSRSNILLDIELGNYLKYFLSVSSQQREWTIRGNSQAVKQMRVWDKFQTVPKDNYPLAKCVIQRVNQAAQKKK